MDTDPGQVIGNDLSANMPTFVPANVKFEVDDVESEWLHEEKFSYIFCRYMAASIYDWPKLVNTIYEFVPPPLSSPPPPISPGKTPTHATQQPRGRRLGRVPRLQPPVLLRRRLPDPRKPPPQLDHDPHAGRQQPRPRLVPGPQTRGLRPRRRLPQRRAQEV